MARWRLEELATARGWKSAYKFAQEARIPYNTVRPIWENEAKRLDLDTVGRIAAFLGVAPGELIGNGEGGAEITD